MKLLPHQCKRVLFGNPRFYDSNQKFVAETRRHVAATTPLAKWAGIVPSCLLWFKHFSTEILWHQSCRVRKIWTVKKHGDSHIAVQLSQVLFNAPMEQWREQNHSESSGGSPEDLVMRIKLHRIWHIFQTFPTVFLKVPCEDPQAGVPPAARPLVGCTVQFDPGVDPWPLGAVNTSCALRCLRAARQFDSSQPTRHILEITLVDATNALSSARLKDHPPMMRWWSVVMHKVPSTSRPFRSQVSWVSKNCPKFGWSYLQIPEDSDKLGNLFSPTFSPLYPSYYPKTGFQCFVSDETTACIAWDCARGFGVRPCFVHQQGVWFRRLPGHRVWVYIYLFIRLFLQRKPLT